MSHIRKKKLRLNLNTGFRSKFSLIHHANLQFNKVFSTINFSQTWRQAAKLMLNMLTALVLIEALKKKNWWQFHIERWAIASLMSPINRKHSTVWTSRPKSESSSSICQIKSSSNHLPSCAIATFPLVVWQGFRRWTLWPLRVFGFSRINKFKWRPVCN